MQAEERIKDLEKQNNELLIQQNDLKMDVNRWMILKKELLLYLLSWIKF